MDSVAHFLLKLLKMSISSLSDVEKILMRERIFGWMSCDGGLRQHLIPPSDACSWEVDEQRKWIEAVVTSALGGDEQAKSRVLLREAASSFSRIIDSCGDPAITDDNSVQLADHLSLMLAYLDTLMEMVSAGDHLEDTVSNLYVQAHVEIRKAHFRCVVRSAVGDLSGNGASQRTPDILGPLVDQHLKVFPQNQAFLNATYRGMIESALETEAHRIVSALDAADFNGGRDDKGNNTFWHCLQDVLGQFTAVQGINAAREFCANLSLDECWLVHMRNLEHEIENGQWKPSRKHPSGASKPQCRAEKLGLNPRNRHQSNSTRDSTSEKSRHPMWASLSAFREQEFSDAADNKLIRVKEEDTNDVVDVANIEANNSPGRTAPKAGIAREGNNSRSRALVGNKRNVQGLRNRGSDTDSDVRVINARLNSHENTGRHRNYIRKSISGARDACGRGAFENSSQPSRSRKHRSSHVSSRDGRASGAQNQATGHSSRISDNAVEEEVLRARAEYMTEHLRIIYQTLPRKLLQQRARRALDRQDTNAAGGFGFMRSDEDMLLWPFQQRYLNSRKAAGRSFSNHALFIESSDARGSELANELVRDLFPGFNRDLSKANRISSLARLNVSLQREIMELEALEWANPCQDYLVRQY